MALNLQDLIGGSIVDGVAKIIQLFKVDPTVALEKQTELQEIQLKMTADAAAAAAAQVQAQLEINKAEASSGDKFTSRWRPAIGWICGLAMFSNFVASPFFTWAAHLLGRPDLTYPTLDMSVMMPVLLGMLGLAGAHVYENTQGGKS
jgi:hypothetical protein